jgi:hypothetical protein
MLNTDCRRQRGSNAYNNNNNNNSGRLVSWFVVCRVILLQGAGIFLSVGGRYSTVGYVKCHLDRWIMIMVSVPCILNTRLAVSWFAPFCLADVSSRMLVNGGVDLRPTKELCLASYRLLEATLGFMTAFYLFIILLLDRLNTNRLL